MEVSYPLHAPDLPSPTKQIPRLLARAQMSPKADLELVLKKDKITFPQRNITLNVQPSPLHLLSYSSSLIVWGKILKFAKTERNLSTVIFYLKATKAAPLFSPSARWFFLVRFPGSQRLHVTHDCFLHDTSSWCNFISCHSTAISRNLHTIIQWDFYQTFLNVRFK
jgi:hypothetical protein